MKKETRCRESFLLDGVAFRRCEKSINHSGNHGAGGFDWHLMWGYKRKHEKD